MLFNKTILKCTTTDKTACILNYIETNKVKKMNAI